MPTVFSTLLQNPPAPIRYNYSWGVFLMISLRIFNVFIWQVSQEDRWGRKRATQCQWNSFINFRILWTLIGNLWTKWYWWYGTIGTQAIGWMSTRIKWYRKTFGTMLEVEKRLENCKMFRKFEKRKKIEKAENFEKSKKNQKSRNFQKKANNSRKA